MGKKIYKGSFFKHFMIIYDPRQEGKVRHKLIDVLFIAVAASICYCNEWLDMEDWTKLTGIGMAIRKCEKNGKVTEERAYHLSSVATVEEYASGVRKH